MTATTSPAGATVSYQWQQANGGEYAPIDGATKSTFALTAEQVNKTVRCECTGTGKYTGTVQSEPTARVKSKTVAVTGVKLNKNSTTIAVGSTEKLTDTVEPTNATNKTVTWESDKTNVATVDGGTITGKAVGDANVTVKTTDGSKTAKCTVKVTDAVKSVTISGTAQVGQTLTANVTPAGATVSYEWQKADTDGGQYAAIGGATAKTYALTDGESGKFIKVKVTGTGNYTGSQTSAATTAVAPAAAG